MAAHTCTCTRMHMNTHACNDMCTRTRMHTQAHGALDGHAATAGASHAGGHGTPGGGGSPHLLGNSSKFRRSPGHAVLRNPVAQPVPAAGGIRFPQSFPRGPSRSPSGCPGSPSPPGFQLLGGAPSTPRAVIKVCASSPARFVSLTQGPEAIPMSHLACPAHRVLPNMSCLSCPACHILPAASQQPDPPVPQRQLDRSCTLNSGSGGTRTVQEGKPSSPRDGEGTAGAGWKPWSRGAPVVSQPGAKL